MAEVGQEISKLLREVDDPDDSAVNRAMVMRFLSASQRVMNTALRRVRTTITRTLPPMVPVRINGIVTKVLRVESVRVDGRDLLPTTLESLAARSSKWFYEIGPKHEAWALVGDALFLYPRVNREVLLEVVVVRMPDELTSDSQTLELSDDDIPFMRDLARQMILFRHRKLDRIPLGVSDGGR